MWHSGITGAEAAGGGEAWDEGAWTRGAVARGTNAGQERVQGGQSGRTGPADGPADERTGVARRQEDRNQAAHTSPRATVGRDGTWAGMSRSCDRRWRGGSASDSGRREPRWSRVLDVPRDVVPEGQGWEWFRNGIMQLVIPPLTTLQILTVSLMVKRHTQPLARGIGRKQPAARAAKAEGGMKTAAASWRTTAEMGVWDWF